MVFVEAMKLLEYESKVNYSFADRLSDVVQESRLDERLAPLVVGAAIGRCWGRFVRADRFVCGPICTAAIRFEAFVAKAVRKVGLTVS